MGYATSDRNGVTVFAIQGKMDDAFLPRMNEVVAKSSRVVVDLSQAHGLRGDDLENLVSAHHLCEKAGGKFSLAAVPDDLAYILDLMELDEFFLISPSVDEAVDSLSPARAGAPMTTMQMIAMVREKILSESAILQLEDPARAAEERVKRVKAVIRYLAPTPDRIELLRYVSSSAGPLEAERTARTLGRDRDWVDAAFVRLAGIRILVKKKRSSELVYDPSPQASAAIRDILEMWDDAANRTKLMEWATNV